MSAWGIRDVWTKILAACGFCCGGLVGLFVGEVLFVVLFVYLFFQTRAVSLFL